MLARVLQNIYKKGIYDEKKESGGMGPKVLLNGRMCCEPMILPWASQLIILFWIFSPVRQTFLIQLPVASLLSPEFCGYYNKVSVAH